MKPSAVILDLLRTYPHRGTTVKTIMATGAMFGLSENVMRVNLSRLVSKGTVENFKRGFYRLTDHTDPLNDFVEGWRGGEDRIRAWDGESWLLVHASAESAPRRHWALDAVGFREVTEDLWLRPDNLARDYTNLEQLLGDLGMDRRSVLVESGRLDQRWQDAFLTQFDVAGMRAEYRAATGQLNESLARLDGMPRVEALKESFHLGGHAVHILAKDPLLPEQYLPGTERAELWRTMLVYDRRGRDIWGGRPEAMPTPQLQVLNN